MPKKRPASSPRSAKAASPRGFRAPQWADPQHRFEGTLRYPNEAEAYFSRERWGDGNAIDAIPGAPTCSLVTVPSPDGLVFAVSCSACGGRAEYLFNSQIPLTSDMHALFLTHAEQQMRSAMDWTMGTWVKRHQACATGATQQVDPDVERVIDGLRERLTEGLTRGQELGGFVGLIFEEGLIFGLGIDDLPPANTEEGAHTRLVEMTARLAMLRDFAAQQPLTVRASVLISEVWMTKTPASEADEGANRSPSMDPNRMEGLVVAYTTPTMGRQALFPITRTGGVVGKGPGALGEPEWYPFRGGIMLTGLMAQPWDRVKPPKDAFLM